MVLPSSVPRVQGAARGDGIVAPGPQLWPIGPTPPASAGGFLCLAPVVPGLAYSPPMKRARDSVRDISTVGFMWVLYRSKQIKHHSTLNDCSRHTKRINILITLNKTLV